MDANLVFSISMHSRKHAHVLKIIEDTQDQHRTTTRSKVVRNLIIQGAEVQFYREALEEQTRRYHSYARVSEQNTGWPAIPISSPLELVEYFKRMQQEQT